MDKNKPCPDFVVEFTQKAGKAILRVRLRLCLSSTIKILLIFAFFFPGKSHYQLKYKQPNFHQSSLSY